MSALTWRAHASGAFARLGIERMQVTVQSGTVTTDPKKRLLGARGLTPRGRSIVTAPWTALVIIIAVIALPALLKLRRNRSVRVALAVAGIDIGTVSARNGIVARASAATERPVLAAASSRWGSTCRRGRRRPSRCRTAVGAQGHGIEPDEPHRAVEPARLRRLHRSSDFLPIAICLRLSG